jgi:hypothetical protein
MDNIFQQGTRKGELTEKAYSMLYSVATKSRISMMLTILTKRKLPQEKQATIQYCPSSQILNIYYHPLLLTTQLKIITQQLTTQLAHITTSQHIPSLYLTLA